MPETNSNTENFPPSENSGVWLVKIITGPFLIILLLIHFIVNHFIGQNGLLSYTDVINYYKNPIIPIMEILFLVTVIFHSSFGIRGIILDLRPTREMMKIIDIFLIVTSVTAIVYGTWLVITIASIR